MDDLDHPEFIEQWKQNLDASAYEENINQDVKLPSVKKQFIVMIKLNTGQQS